MANLNDIDNFVEYIKELDNYKKTCLICFAARDTLHAMNDEARKILEDFGVKNLRAGWNGYVFIMNQGQILVDKHSGPNESVLEYLELQDIDLQVISKSWRAGNIAKVVINGYDMSVGKRGLNIVVFDVTSRFLVDSVGFDFFPETTQPCRHTITSWRGPILDKKLVYEEIDDSFDIDDILDGIVEKYNLDEVYPKYMQIKKASKAIKRISEEWDIKENIACITVGDSINKCQLDAMQFCKNISPLRRNQIDFIYCQRKKNFNKDHFWYYSWDALDYSPLEHRWWDGYQRIYLISNKGSNFVGYWLRKHNVNYIDLYDYLENQNVLKQDSNLEYYEFLPDNRESRCFFKDIHASCTEWALYEEKEKFSMYAEGELALMSAKKCFFLSLVLRDFVQAKKWYENILNFNPKNECYLKAWTEIESLLERIKLAFCGRKTNDIIAVWVDTVTQVSAKIKMPFVSSMQEKSAWFENMITMTAFTRETRRSMFTGKKLIDDETNNINKIGLFNSQPLRDLYEKGYKINIFETREKMFDVPFISSKCLQEYDQGTPRLWEAVRQTLLSKKSCFSLVALMGCHPPFYMNRIDDKNIIDDRKRSEAAFKDVDDQLKFYLDLIGNNTTSIVFSDHGFGDFWPRNHVFFFIYGSKIRPRKIDGLCCNIDFSSIINQILEHGDIIEKDLIRDFVEIQGVPLLRGGRFVETDNPLLPAAAPKYHPPFLGYKGIVTKDYVYIHFAGGREWLSQRDKMQPKLSWYARPDDICDVNLLTEMRAKAGIDYGNEPPDYGPRSEYYLSIQDTYEKNYAYNEKKLKLINKLVTRMPVASTALYLGNGVSREAYLALSLENRKKIDCIIDKAANCACADLDVPVVSLENVTNRGIRNIVVSSRTLPVELKDFLINHGQTIHAFGLYGWFEVNGYHTKHNFYDFAIQSMDAPLPTPLSIPDFLNHAAPGCPCEVSVVTVVQDESTLLSRLHDILRQVSLGMRIYCLDLTGKAAEVVKDYQKVTSCIEVIHVDGYSSLPEKMNELISSANTKYILFLSADEYLHAKGLFYLHEIAEQMDAEVVAAGLTVAAKKDGKPDLTDFSTGSFELKKEARILPATFDERYAEWSENGVPSFTGSRLYRVDFLRKYNIIFPAIRFGWRDIFCLQTIFESAKYVKVPSPVCISSNGSLNKSLDATSVENAKELVGDMFAYQQAIETLLRQMNAFGNNSSLCDKFRERAMTIFDQQYFSSIALDDEIRNAVSQTVQEKLQKNPSIGVWWIKYLFMRSSFPQNV